MYFHKDKKDEERPVLLTQGKNIRKTAKQVGLGLHSWLHIKGFSRLYADVKAWAHKERLSGFREEC
jgi:predicted NACHT family NTPase